MAILGNIKLYRKLSSLQMYLQPNFRNSLKVNWFKSKNFGDALNPILIEYITGVKTAWIASEFYNKTNLCCIGSILQIANENSIVWGSGFINESNTFNYGSPKKIYAVRGPRTRNKLLKIGVECPSIFGDPALLMPTFYNPKVEKKYKLGIIPHYMNQKDIVLLKYKNNSTIKIINVMQENPLNVINDIISCEKILSSSLHGIIISDVYKIPSQWIKLNKEINKDDFKFYDYAEGVDKEIFPIDAINTDLEKIPINQSSFNINFNPELLQDNFPRELI